MNWVLIIFVTAQNAYNSRTISITSQQIVGFKNEAKCFEAAKIIHQLSDKETIVKTSCVLVK